MNLITVGTPGRALPRSLQDIITVRADRHAALASAAVLPQPAPRTLGRDGRAGSRGGGGGGGGGGVIVPRGGRRNDRDGEVIPNPRHIQHIRILSG